MDQEDLLALIARVEKGTATDEELARYNAWCNAFQADEQPVPDFDRISKNMLEAINQQIGPKRRRVPVYRVAAAAAVLAIAATAAWYWYPRNETITAPQARHQQQQQPAEKVTLVLGDGSRITLDDAKEGELAATSGARVIKLKGDQLAYEAASGAPAKLEYNTLQTPRGEKYRITLPDGSQVWLNASTTLRFPTRFEGKERVVELTGEAYFDIAQNAAQPFKVKSGDMEVQVLGTGFNIMAYPDEPAIRATLLTGAVRLASNEQQVLLKPGQQGIYKSTQTGFKVTSVNTDHVVAWKNGLFVFENEDIATIMRRIARWYDVEVELAPGLEDKRFGATISQQKNIQLVLKALETTGSVHFKIQGKKILVMP
ncbi:DUF4974 domain-containing protein [Chitinophaga horti]|uniref:DUF4974 domain-containing protein n=1 Tax=Chitinophaga horti TaxID=2920382 RepID=A0ABY6J8H1_9BACT|nr:FecR family protein [Chitinophaga horti]UYQ95938.1 DUF4974 domain-containing protein [Chitinophaga horti]